MFLHLSKPLILLNALRLYTQYFFMCYLSTLCKTQKFYCFQISGFPPGYVSIISHAFCSVSHLLSFLPKVNLNALDVTLSVFPFVIDCDITVNSMPEPAAEDVIQVMSAKMTEWCYLDCHLRYQLELLQRRIVFTPEKSIFRI